MVYQATKKIARAFDEAGLKHDIIEASGSSAVKAGFRGENVEGVMVHFISSDDDNDVKVVVLNFLKVPAAKRGKVLEVCNNLNYTYRYAKFLLDNDSDVRVEYDLPLRNTDPGNICVEIMIRFMKILDDAYPEFMKALWS